MPGQDPIKKSLLQRNNPKGKSKKFMDKRTGDKKDPNNVIIKKEKPDSPRPNSPKAFEKILSIKDAAKQVVAEGGSPNLIQDEARMDRMDKLLGIIPSEKMAKGGRAGYKAGSKGCKLAMKGKGRAYGKNS